MFEAKATLIQFLGDVERSLCHFGYKIGYIFTYDGELFHPK